MGGRLADRIGEYRIIPSALVLTGGGLLALRLLGVSTLLMLSRLILGCGDGFLFPSLNSLAVPDEPIPTQGKIIGAFTGGIDAGAFAGSITLGYIGEKCGLSRTLRYSRHWAVARAWQLQARTHKRRKAEFLRQSGN